MESELFETKEYLNETISARKFAEQDLSGVSFSGCKIIDCDFTRAKLCGADLNDCIFQGCNFSNAKINGSKLHGIKFKECKFMGVDFSALQSMLISFVFEGGKAEFCDFKRLDLRACSFCGTSLKDSDFGRANLQKTDIINCNLCGTIFTETDLREADLRGSVNCFIDPSKNKMHGAKFSLSEAAGLLAAFGVELE